MSLIFKIGIFILFLIAYALWAFGSYALMSKLKRDLLHGKSFWNSQLSILLTVAPFLLFVYLLSGFFNLKLVIIFFAAGELGVILTAILWGFLGSTTAKWGAHSQWAGSEFGLKHRGLMLMMMTLSTVILFGYPIIAGWAYFTLSSGELINRIFQYTLLAFILSGYPFMLLILIGTLVSENLDEMTRTRFFVTQLSGLIMTGLFLALAFWAFGIVGKGIQLPIGGFMIALSLELLVFLIGFFVLTTLIPYLIGAKQAKKWREQLLEKQKDFLDNILDILDFPAASHYASKLNQLRADLDNEMNEFMTKDYMVEMGIQMDQGSIPVELKEIAPAYLASRDIDPRFKHLDWSRQFMEKVKEVIEDLAQQSTDADKERAAKDWAKSFYPRKDELSKEIEAAQKTKVVIGAFVGTAMMTIMTVILNEFAKWIWTFFSRSLK